MEWHRPQCPWRGHFKVPVSRKDPDHCLVDYEELILVDAVPREDKINSDTYVRMLTEIRKRFEGNRPLNRYLALT
jgi:hypothetical protein